jgi:HupE / UreJ protein
MRQKYKIVNDFSLWFSIGFLHIADWQGYDHILFLIALCGIYTLKEMKRTVFLITSFTVGHSTTLALSTLSLISCRREWIEFLIPVTILLTAVLNLCFIRDSAQTNFRIRYFSALIFGFIHGMGFSFLLRSLLEKSESVALPLLAFNSGLETAQIIIINGSVNF